MRNSHTGANVSVKNERSNESYHFTGGTALANNRMIYTPKNRIPIGEAVKRPDGSHAIRVKNPRTNRTDEITLDSLVEEVVQKAKAAETRTETLQGLAAQ